MPGAIPSDTDPCWSQLVGERLDAVRLTHRLANTLAPTGFVFGVDPANAKNRSPKRSGFFSDRA